MTHARSRIAQLLLGVAALCLVPGRAGATPGTCTVVGDGISLLAFVPSAGGKIESPPDPPGSVDGLQLPVDIDAASGRFMMLRATVPDVALGTDAGDVILHMAGPDVSGTLDAAGNAVLPGFSVDQILGTIMLPIAPTMTTGIVSRDIPGNQFVDHGAPLDFTTGILTLVGPDVIQDAPIVHEPVISEVQLKCRLDPKPDPASLPAAPTGKVTGKAVISGGDQGDSLRLKAKLTPGATPFDFAGGDLYVRVAAADSSTVVLTRVLAGMLKAKGKKFSAKDKDGSVIGVLVGKRPSPAPAGGNLAATNGKKKASLSLRLVGLDLSTLGTSAQVTVQVGSNVAKSNVTVSGNGKKRTLR